MPPLGNKGKSKGGRDARSSRSRNTTPSSVVSAPLSSTTQTTAYLDIPVSSLSIPTSITYDDILERHGGSGGIPDPKHLEALANDLKKLSQMAETRGQACDGGMRELASRRKERVEEEREREQAKQEAEEKENLKRAAEEDEESRSRKAVKPKKRKERSSIREERPLVHGAHGVARQDGIDVNMKGTFLLVCVLKSFTPMMLLYVAWTFLSFQPAIPFFQLPVCTLSMLVVIQICTSSSQ